MNRKALAALILIPLIATVAHAQMGRLGSLCGGLSSSLRRMVPEAICRTQFCDNKGLDDTTVLCLDFEEGLADCEALVEDSGASTDTGTPVCNYTGAGTAGAYSMFIGGTTNSADIQALWDFAPNCAVDGSCIIAYNFRYQNAGTDVGFHDFMRVQDQLGARYIENMTRNGDGFLRVVCGGDTENASDLLTISTNYSLCTVANSVTDVATLKFATPPLADACDGALTATTDACTDLLIGDDIYFRAENQNTDIVIDNVWIRRL